LAPSTPQLHSGRIVVRSDRPSSIVAPNRNITKVEIGDVGQQPQRRPCPKPLIVQCRTLAMTP
jgi:hypothetical protein